MGLLVASQVARSVASREWPQVQRQVKIGPGVFGFSCAGHGGIVAVVECAQLPAFAVEAARACGLVRSVYVPSVGRAVEVWIGEEDCDWSTIVLAKDSLRVGALGRYLSADVTCEDVDRSCKDWNPDFYGLVTGATPSAEDSAVVGTREWDARHAGDFVTAAAWGDWCETVPAGMVGVVAHRKFDDAEAYFLVSSEEYDLRGEQTDRRPLVASFVVDVERHGAWVGPRTVGVA